MFKTEIEGISENFTLYGFGPILRHLLPLHHCRATTPQPEPPNPGPTDPNPDLCTTRAELSFHGGVEVA